MAGPGVPRRSGASADARRRNALLGTNDSVLALGASTGGTEALMQVISVLPEVTPGILVVQHMPVEFTAGFAQRLDRASQMEVREARDGDEFRQGLVLLAPGDRHMRLREGPRGRRVELRADAPVNRHRPAVDVLFDSLAEICGPKTVAALLTGMGADGAAGLLRLREAGAVTLAQDQETCVVYGMPRAAVELGAVRRSLPLKKIAPALLAASMHFSGPKRMARPPSSLSR